MGLILIGIGLVAGLFFGNENLGAGLFFAGTIIGFIEWGDDSRKRHGPLFKPREVHHYHRITLDKNGNPVEVTDYEERH